MRYLLHNYPSIILINDELIRSASNMFTLYTCKDNHVWGSKSPKESDLVALKAEVKKFKGDPQLAGKITKNYR